MNKGESTNYGKYETERKLKSLRFKSGKYVPRLFLNIFKALFVLCLSLAIVGVSIGFSMVKGIIDNIPSVDILNIQLDRFAITVYDVTGNLTDTLVTSGFNYESITYDELLQNLVSAFVAIESSRPGSHNSTDIRSIVHAMWGVISDDYAGGGSTITQQLIKSNMFPDGMELGWGVKIERKPRGQYSAVQPGRDSGISREETRNLIIINHLDTINLGNNILSVKVAAKHYSNKNASDLAPPKRAVLASVTRSPSKPNPISGRENSAEWYKIMFQYMYDQGFTSEEEQKGTLADDIYDRTQNMDTATKESNTRYSYFTDEPTERVISSPTEKLDYSESQASNPLYSGRPQIYTIQDPDLWAIVDEEINNPDNCSAVKYSVEYRLSVTHMDGNTQYYSEENLKTFHKTELDNPSFDGLYKIKGATQADTNAFRAWLLRGGDEIIGKRQNLILQFQTSFMPMDQHTGKIKALCDDCGKRRASLTPNRTSSVYHQSGSAFKVISAFTPAVDACGATLGAMYYDAPYTIGTKTFRSQRNKGYGFVGYHNIRDGIIYSMNIVAVRTLMETTTPQLGIEYVENMDTSSLAKDDLGAATALGGLTKGVFNLELTATYIPIVNAGVYTKPRFFIKVLDHNGKVLIGNELETKQMLKDSAAFLLTDTVSRPVKSNRLFARSGISINSTNTRAALIGTSVAGKSGTTTANSDMRFVGHTSCYIAGIWGGCGSSQKLSNGNEGASSHKDIWRSIMNHVRDGMSDPGFTTPDSIETAEICRESGKRVVIGVYTAGPGGSMVYTEYLAKGTTSTEACDKHVAATVCVESGMCSTLYYPIKTIRVCMTLPDGENDVTDDSALAIPGYYPIHTDVSTIIGLSPDESGGDGPVVTPIRPGCQSPTSPSSTTEGYGSGNIPYQEHNNSRKQSCRS